MKWLTFKIRHEPGFRFNLLDLMLILTLIAVSIAWHAVFPEQYLYLLPLYVGGSFFLFCNIFRIGNRLELPWYLTFVIITAYGFTLPTFPWQIVLTVCEALKWGLITYRIRQGSYVGVFRRQLARFSGF